MTFRQFLRRCNDLVKARPEVLDYEAVFASDEEGNSFHPVYYTATVGEMYEGEFNDESEHPNAVCVN